MKASGNPTLIGAFLLGALALIALAVIGLGGAAIFTPKQRAVVYFEGSVQGLAVGASVNFRGVQVGTVDRISLQLDPKSLTAKIPVFLTLKSRQIKLDENDQRSGVPLEDLIQKGLRAQLNTQSFVTGQLNIMLDFHPEAPARLFGSPDPDIAEIPTMRSGFDAIKEQFSNIPFGQLADDLRQTISTVRTLSTQSSVLVQNADAELRLTAATTRETLKAAQVALKNANLAMQDITASSRLARQTLQEVSPQLQATLIDAQKAFDHADETLVRYDKVAGQVLEMTAPGGGTRVALDDALTDISSAARSLQRLADTLDREPNSLLRGKAPTP